VAVGFRRINKMLQALAPEFADRAAVEVLDVGFEEAVARVRALQAQRPVDVVVAAGSNGGYLRQHLDLPVVVVKVGGFDLMQALARAKRQSSRIGLVTYVGVAPDIHQFDDLFGLGVHQRSYRTEDEAQEAVRELQQEGVTSSSARACQPTWPISWVSPASFCTRWTPCARRSKTRSRWRAPRASN